MDVLCDITRLFATLNYRCEGIKYFVSHMNDSSNSFFDSLIRTFEFVEVDGAENERIKSYQELDIIFLSKKGIF